MVGLCELKPVEIRVESAWGAFRALSALEANMQGPCRKRLVSALEAKIL
jgi:hypothetical protein